jgi:hypothetical protein
MYAAQCQDPTCQANAFQRLEEVLPARTSETARPVLTVLSSPTGFGG